MAALQFGDDAELLEIKAVISTELFEALASALRRGERGEAIEQLDRWYPPRPYSMTMGLNAAQSLTVWLQKELRLHVEGSRYQHALALLERYVTLPVPLNRADALALSKRLDYQ